MFETGIPQYRRITPRITRRPAPLLIDDISRVGGRVHALVMRRPTPAGARTSRDTSSATRAPQRPAPAHHTAA
jgi:hypothetical protein